MTILKDDEIFSRMDQLGTNRVPFLFIISFDKTEGIVLPLEENTADIRFKINETPGDIHRKILFAKNPVSKETYQQQFEVVCKNIVSGKASVVNLTCSTPITTDLTLQEIFEMSDARYKLYLKDNFVCFSPETFIKTKEDFIAAYPMKGTIDNNVPNAKEILLNDEKEIKEHAEVVNMMIGDLLQVADDVTVTNSRYIDAIKTTDKTLLQTSSEIKGTLQEKYRLKIGSLFRKLLPAASICGYPRSGSMEIIKAAETHQRNFYTGVSGIFDGQDVDSGVLIRFIEKTSGGLVYKSGGGITINSDYSKEYHEMIDKVYVPIN